MEVKINFTQEMKSEIRSSIDYYKNEFDLQFGQKTEFSESDKRIALELLDHFSENMDTAMCIDYLSDMLRYLETRYEKLF